MVQDLKKINLFKDLSKSQLGSIKKICRKKKYGAGKVIFEENVVSPGLYIVLSGIVRVVKKLEDTKVDETLTLIQAGGFFGELSFVDGRAHSATIIAVRDTELLEIAKDDFDRLAESDPLLACEIAKKIVSEMIQVLRVMDEKFIEMMKFVWDRSH